MYLYWEGKIDLLKNLIFHTLDGGLRNETTMASEKLNKYEENA